MNEVILVDKNDIAVGKMEKIEAHEKGLLHRAFSIFIFNNTNQLMLQQRALSKYHSAGLWTNTVCSHPMPEENTLDASHRRLHEEMGIKTTLERLFAFTYKVRLDNNLIENEYDHIIIGHYNDLPKPNPDEVMAWKWMDKEAILTDIKDNPSTYSYWFKKAYPRVMNLLINKKTLRDIKS